MPPSLDFDYWEGLRLNAQDSRILEDDVRRFITAKSSQSFPTRLGKVSDSNEVGSLIETFLQHGLPDDCSESLAPDEQTWNHSKSIRPGSEMWVHPMKGSSCSELKWPEDVERITHGLQKLFKMIMQDNDTSPRAKRKRISGGGTSFTPVNHTLEEDRIPTPGNVRPNSTPNLATTPPRPMVVIDDDPAEGDGQGPPSSSKLKRPRRKGKESSGSMLPPTFVVPRPVRAGHMSQPSSNSRRPRKNLQMSIPKNTTKQKSRLPLASHRSPGASPIERNPDSENPLLNEHHGRTSPVLISHTGDRPQEGQVFNDCPEAAGHHEASPSVFSVTETILGDMASSVPEVRQVEVAEEHAWRSPQCPDIQSSPIGDRDFGHNEASPESCGESNLDMDDMYRENSWPLPEANRNDQPEAEVPTEIPDPSHNDAESQLSSNHETTETAADVFPDSPRFPASSDFAPASPASMDMVGNGSGGLSSKVRIWILESESPCVTWDYCTKTDLLDEGIESIADHVKYHCGISSLDAMNCQIKTEHERRSIDILLNNISHAEDARQVIRETLLDAQSEDGQERSRITVFLKPTEVNACA